MILWSRQQFHHDLLSTSFKRRSNGRRYYFWRWRSGTRKTMKGLHVSNVFLTRKRWPPLDTAATGRFRWWCGGGSWGLGGCEMQIPKMTQNMQKLLWRRWWWRRCAVESLTTWYRSFFGGEPRCFALHPFARHKFPAGFACGAEGRDGHLSATSITEMTSNPKHWQGRFAKVCWQHHATPDQAKTIYLPKWSKMYIISIVIHQGTLKYLHDLTAFLSRKNLNLRWFFKKWGELCWDSSVDKCARGKIFRCFFGWFWFGNLQATLRGPRHRVRRDV